VKINRQTSSYLDALTNSCWLSVRVY